MGKIMENTTREADECYMKEALSLAEKGRGHTSPNPLVGAVIVKNGTIVGRGYHQVAGGPHAEVNAIADAGGKAFGATMYVTLEPCNHFGRTPPCTRAICEAGISRVVVAMADPNPAVAGGGSRFLQKRGVKVQTGVSESEARKMNAFYIKYIQTGLPYVILKCAATLDGRIATESGDSRWITGAAARDHVHRLRHAVDGILVGVDTVRADDPQLTCRLKEGGKDPLRIILDTRLRIPESAGIVGEEQASGTILVTGPLTASRPEADPGACPGSERKKRFIARGVQVIETACRDNRIEPRPLLEKLGKMGITSILAEGGSRVSGSLLKAGVVDRVCFFYAPKILAGDGIPVCRGPGPEKMADCLSVSNIEIKRFGDDILIEGDVIN